MKINKKKNAKPTVVKAYSLDEKSVSHVNKQAEKKDCSASSFVNSLIREDRKRVEG